jgi:dTDP-4-dehydrorhamnose 3,5-epimerase
MSIKNTKIAGFYEIDVPVHLDERGYFEQWFTQYENDDEIGDFQPVQANTSTSKKGVIRGMHYSSSLDGQAKMVICVHGKIRDVAVDIRLDSPTFGEYDVIELEGGSGKVSFIDVGLAHGFEVLSESATIVYLLSSKYSPFFEKEINPLDADINIDWVTENPILSEKDRNAPSLKALTGQE